MIQENKNTLITMATFSKVNFKTVNYNSFRPHYPSTFYKILSTYATEGNETRLPLKKALDLGCGTGVATYSLLNFVDDVTGVDVSPLMIETAKSMIPQRCEQMNVNDTSRIKFKTGSAESFVNLETKGIENNSIDLIVAAQCIHWFQDYSKFYKSCASLLKQGGTLAYWYYVDPIVIDFQGPSKGEKKDVLKKAFQIYNKYVYDDPNYIGPHWEQPGRNIIKNLCVEVNEPIPRDLYSDIKIQTYVPDFDGNIKPTEEDLVLEKLNMLINDFIDYLHTYSGFHNYKEATGDKDDLVELFLNECETELGWEREKTRIDIVWRTGYTFMKKK